MISSYFSLTLTNFSREIIYLYFYQKIKALVLANDYIKHYIFLAFLELETKWTVNNYCLTVYDIFLWELFLEKCNKICSKILKTTCSYYQALDFQYRHKIPIVFKVLQPGPQFRNSAETTAAQKSGLHLHRGSARGPAPSRSEEMQSRWTTGQTHRHAQELHLRA